MKKAKERLDQKILACAEKIIQTSRHNRALRRVASADTAENVARSRRPSLGSQSHTIPIDLTPRSRSLPRRPSPPSERPPEPPIGRAYEIVPLTPAEEIKDNSDSADDSSEYVEMMDLQIRQTPLELSGADSQVHPDEDTQGAQSTVMGDTTGRFPRTASVSTADTEDSQNNFMARLAAAESLKRTIGRIVGYDTDADEGIEATLYRVRLDALKHLVGSLPTTWNHITSLPLRDRDRIKQIFDIRYLDELKNLRDVLKDEDLIMQADKQQTLEYQDRHRPTSTPARAEGAPPHDIKSPVSDIHGVGATLPHKVANFTYTTIGDRV